MARTSQAQASSKRIKIVADGNAMMNAMQVQQQQQQRVVTPNNSSGGLDPFQALNNETLCHILSFLVSPPAAAHATAAPQQHSTSDFKSPSPIVSPFSFQQSPFPANHKASQEQQDVVIVEAYNRLCCCRDVSQVSKRWKTTVGILMNVHVSEKIMDPLHLFELKCRALTLDLEPVCRDFMKRIQRKWTKIRVNDLMNAYNLITTGFSGGSKHAFVNLVASEYVKFLVVKSVETLMRNKASLKENCVLQYWKQPCRPPMVVMLFWQSHIQFPMRYACDCNMLLQNLLGEVNSIDNILEPLIVDDDTEDSLGWNDYASTEGLDYHRKKAALFQFERLLPRMNVYFGRFGELGMNGDEHEELLFSDWFNAEAFAKEMRERSDE